MESKTKQGAMIALKEATKLVMAVHNGLAEETDPAVDADARRLWDHFEEHGDLHLSPYAQGPHGPDMKASVHDTAKDRIYNGPSARVAVANAIADINPILPNYAVRQLPGHADFKGNMTEADAKAKGLLS